MSRFVQVAIVIALLTAVAGVAGGWIGVRIGLQQARDRAGLDEMVHHQMHLTPDQDRQIEALERNYRSQRLTLEARIGQANSDLADAITSERAYGPKARVAIGRLHQAMGELQEDTIRHALAMRAVMTPEQTRRFDALINRALKPPAT